MSGIVPGSLGSASLRKDYGLRYAYFAGAMYKGIASKELVVAMGRAGFMSYLGTGGLQLEEIDAAIRHIQATLADGHPYGMNLLCNLEYPELEQQTVQLFLDRGIRFIEAAAFLRITPALVRYRLSGLRRDPFGNAEARHRVLAKVSRPEVAAAFMQPAPPAIVQELRASNLVTASEAELAAKIPMANEICVEADSGGHTDQGVAYALLPAMLSLRDEMQRRLQYVKPILVGAAGGIGTPHAAAASFVMGADFVLTGSINQCTVEAGTSDAVKDLLQELNVQDTTYAPAGDMFEIGAKVQVAKRGLFFPARANKLHELYHRYDSIEQLEPQMRQQIEEKYFRRSFADVWAETRAHYERTNPRKLADVERNPKQRMALLFKWYFTHSTRLALRGAPEQKVDYQIQCGPAMGAFNQWVKGSEIASWRQRHVADIAARMMGGTAQLLEASFASLRGSILEHS